MASGYEQELTEKKQELAVITEEQQSDNEQERIVTEFMEKAKRYVEMPELTTELLHIFINRIEGKISCVIRSNFARELDFFVACV